MSCHVSEQRQTRDPSSTLLPTPKNEGSVFSRTAGEQKKKGVGALV